MTGEQVQLRELLKDPLYKAWFCKPPKARYNARWTVYAQVEHEGPWRKKDFNTWIAAYKFLRKHLKEWHDAALCCKNWGWRPPVVRNAKGRRNYHAPSVALQYHVWCPYCRRPTRFGYFRKHHNVPNCIPWKQRCIICGISESAIKKYHLRGD